MIANTTEAQDFKQHDSFFDYWHYSNIDIVPTEKSRKTAEKIAKKIILKQTCKDLPAHCSQLLFLA